MTDSLRPLDTLAERAAIWRAEIAHKRKIHCETVAITIDELEAILDRAELAMPATSGYAQVVGKHDLKRGPSGDWDQAMQRFDGLTLEGGEQHLIAGEPIHIPPAPEEGGAP